MGRGLILLIACQTMAIVALASLHLASPERDSVDTATVSAAQPTSIPDRIVPSSLEETGRVDSHAASRANVMATLAAEVNTLRARVNELEVALTRNSRHQSAARELAATQRQEDSPMRHPGGAGSEDWYWNAAADTSTIALPALSVSEGTVSSSHCRGDWCRLEINWHESSGDESQSDYIRALETEVQLSRQLGPGVVFSRGPATRDGMTIFVSRRGEG